MADIDYPSPVKRIRIGGIGATSLSIALLASLLVGTQASASHAVDLASIKAKVQYLQQVAASAGEQAQAAQVQFQQLSRKLSSVQAQVASQQSAVNALQGSIGAIAADLYKQGGFSQSMQLLFSSNPTLFLAAVGSLDSISKGKAIALRKYSAAKQSLTATTFTVGDQITLAKAAQTRYVAKQKAAQDQLAMAEAILAKLTKEERARVEALINGQENADQLASLADIKNAKFGSGIGSVALKYAIKQLGDRYVFGAAGPTWWDCSGLTMRAFQSAGISLPHSAAAQMRFGKSIPRNKLQPGDLVFFAFGRSGYVDHVGIFLGGNQMVNAPHPGARVKVESFGSSFGYLKYAGARRF
jgi:cell wall-associated NlpC family hydrolase